MRAILLIFIIAIVALIAAFATGLIDITQTREARAPNVGARDGAISAQGGQSPAFEVQTGSVEVGTREANVAVPKVEVRPSRTKVQVPSVEVRKAEAPEANAN